MPGRRILWGACGAWWALAAAAGCVDQVDGDAEAVPRAFVPTGLAGAFVGRTVGDCVDEAEWWSVGIAADPTTLVRVLVEEGPCYPHATTRATGRLVVGADQLVAATWSAPDGTTLWRFTGAIVAPVAPAWGVWFPVGTAEPGGRALTTGAYVRGTGLSWHHEEVWETTRSSDHAGDLAVHQSVTITFDVPFVAAAAASDAPIACFAAVTVWASARSGAAGPVETGSETVRPPCRVGPSAAVPGLLEVAFDADRGVGEPDVFTRAGAASRQPAAVLRAMQDAMPRTLWVNPADDTTLVAPGDLFAQTDVAPPAAPGP